MIVLNSQGRPDLAVVYIAENADGKRFEFVESLQPPLPRHKKWVNILSTLYGCPLKCPICDAGGNYQGILSAAEIFFQIDQLIQTRFPQGFQPPEKWKIQFARMGEPAFNPAVLEVIENLHLKYNAPNLMPCISTVAPSSCENFFHQLLELKYKFYPLNFQLQFSLHTTNEELRRELIPLQTWPLKQIAEYGESFHIPNGRKITLNFALLEDAPVDPDVLRQYFDPSVFIIKVTPVNPTYRFAASGMKSLFENYPAFKSVIENLRSAGYTVIESIGELQENAIGSNCGQYLTALEKNEALVYK